MKHVWQCVCTAGAGCGGSGETSFAQNAVTAWSTVELPFPVQLGGVNTGFTYNAEGGIETGGADPEYTASTGAYRNEPTLSATIQKSDGWGVDAGNSGDGDLFSGTHTHDTNQVKVTLPAGTHT